MLHCSVVILFMIVSTLIYIGIIHLTENIADCALLTHKSRSTHLFVKSLQI